MTSATTTTQNAPLKVTIICNSDNLGGAAVVTRRLAHALQGEGVEANILVFHKLSTDETVHCTCSRLKRASTFLGERLGIFLRNGFSRSKLFKVSTASAGIDLSTHPLVKDADVIMLSWVNQGLLSLKGISKLASLGKPVVWTMHDMWNMTGICHHAYECEAYMKECGHCRFLSGYKHRDLSYRVQRAKASLYKKSAITFVAVSNWLGSRASKSALLRDADVRVIPNAFPIDSFYTKSSVNLPFIIDKKYVIVMGAARLDDPIKGLPYAIDALNHLFDNYPELSRKSIAVFFGDTKSNSCFDELRFPYHLMGPVNDGNILRQLYARADVVLSTSLYETLPGTLIEGMAAGAVPVSFGRGGQDDIYEHRKTGYTARYMDSTDIADGIRWAATARLDRDMLHDQIHQRFSAKVVATKYLQLFRELLEGRQKEVR